LVEPSQTPAPQGLTKAIVSGTQWTYTSFAISAIVQLLFTVVMSRLLAPQDFGVFAVAMVFVNLARQVGQLGLGHAVVQKASLTAVEVRNAFTVGLALACTLALGVMALSNPLASLMNAPDARPLIMALTVDFVLAGAAITSLSLLRRDLRFRRLSLIEVSASVLGYLVVGLGSAIAGAGVWSLVLAVLVYDGTTLLMSYAATRHPIRPRLRRAEFSPLLSYGGTLSVIGILEYIHASADTFAISRYVGSSQLGQYNRASVLVSVPFTRVAAGLSRVLFPTFSAIQNDPARIAPGYSFAFLAVGGLLGPLSGGLAAAADIVVRVVLGDQWSLAADLLPAALVIATANTLAMFGGIVSDAMGRLRPRLMIQSTALAALILGLLLAAPHGIFAIVFVVAGIACARFLAYVVIAGRLLQVSLRTQACDLVRILAGVVLTYLPIRLLTASLAPQLTDPAALALAMLLGGSILLLLWAIGPFASARRDIARRVAATVSSDRLRGIVAKLG
jgi:lipopolysaccharide exporter